MIVAWHGDPALKAEVAARMWKHRAADEFLQGLYQLINPNYASGYKGCLIGCTLPPEPISDHEHVALRHSDGGVEPSSPLGGWHGRVEQLYGIPRPVGYLLDKIFESLPVDDGQHAWFAVESIEAVPVGADLSLVSSHLMLDILADPKRGVLRHTVEGSAPRAAVERVISLYARRLSGDEPARQEWLDARKDAYAYATTAAAYAAYAYAADAYAAAAYAAYAAYATDAYAAYAAYAADAARPSWWTWAAERLIHHLATAPVPVKI